MKILERLKSELELSSDEANLYLRILKEGKIPVESAGKEISILIAKGMVIVSGDNKNYIPVHPRLAISNHYRTWRERVIREINDRRMRIDRLILELIPIYEKKGQSDLAGERRDA